MERDLYSRLLAVAVDLTRQLDNANAAVLRSLEEDRERLRRQREGLGRYLLTRDILSPALANAN